uniref:Uncharacterized protein n=1 Tax=Salix viminalis TaxID=40686 RepID=A0A6N2KX18_SALVM
MKIVQQSSHEIEIYEQETLENEKGKAYYLVSRLYLNPLTQTLKTLAKTAILIDVAASIAAIESLNSLLQQKLENGQDEEALKIVQLLVAAQPEVTEWKFLMARLLNEMGRAQDARNVFEEILVANPLSFEALFENALLMDRLGEGEAVIRRLQEALDIAEEENKVKEARDVRLIMAADNSASVEDVKSYQELSKEDPKDFRPYVCRGMIYSLLDRNEEAKQQFAKYRELSPKKFEVEGYLRTSLSRMKLFGSNEKN